MDIEQLKKETRKEVIADLIPAYQSAMQDLELKRKIVAEKEKFFDFFLRYFIDKMAIDNVKRELENEKKSNESGSKTISA